jgi:HD-GYP domain-containing protein (c-di-GMP phosphodiesterase class II)
MVRLSDIIKQDTLKKSVSEQEKRPEILKEDKKEETVDHDSFNKIEAGVQFKDMAMGKKEETIDQNTFEQLEAGVQFKDIITEKKEIIKKAEDKERLKQYEQIYNNIYEFFKGVITAIKAGRKPELSQGFKLLEQIVDNTESLDILYKKAIYAKGLDTTVLHGVNVMVYALKIGQGLGFNRKQLIDLGIASLLHDIGMIRIPDSIVNKTEKLTDEELNLLKRHPIFGHEILSKLYPEYPWIAEVALQEQERVDGQGYPQGLKGDEINIYAKIVAVVDVYEALTHQRPQRKRYLPNEAVKMIVQKERDSFDKKVIKAMLTKLSAFPLYSYIRLNSKAIGMVIELDELSPLRPTLQIIFDDKGRKIAGEKIIKLKDTPLLYITDSIDEENLPK